MTYSQSPKLNPLQREGLGQSQRLVEAILPENMPIDSRSLPDMLKYVHDYSKLLCYYSTSNDPVGSWEDFIENDPMVSLALLSLSEGEVRKLKEKFDGELKDTSPDTFEQIFKIGGSLWRIIALLARWNRNAVAGNALYLALGDVREIASDILNVAPEVSEIAKYVAVIRRDGPSEENEDSFFTYGDPQQHEDLESLRIWLSSGQLNYAKIKNTFTCSDIEQNKAILSYKMGILYKTALYIIDQSPNYIKELDAGFSGHQPHIGLLITFLKLFRHTQNHLNTLTEKHLNFFYRDVLKLDNRPEQPDKLHLVFEPVKSNPLKQKIEKHTLVSGGISEDGRELLYATNGDFSVTQAKVDEKNGLLTLKNKKREGIIEVGRIPFDSPTPQDTSGANVDVGENDPTSPIKVGFAISSPVLKLSEGKRTITLKLRVEGDANSFKINRKDIKEKAKAYASGKTGSWNELKIKDLLAQNNDIFIHLLADNTSQPICPHNIAYPEGLQTNDPIITFGFEGEGDRSKWWSYYSYFKGLKISQVDIDVQVVGVKNLIVENDLGVLNVSKPIMPFGPVPEKGSKFYIGSSEIFSKNLKKMKISLSWQGVPENFATHYKSYFYNRWFSATALGGKNTLQKLKKDGGGDYFKVNISRLSGNKWINCGSDKGISLFREGRDKKVPPSVESEFAIDLPYHPPQNAKPFARYSPSLEYGFVRFELQQSFFHEIYPQVLFKEAQRFISWKSLFGGAVGGLGRGVPEPYTPTIDKVELTYSAGDSISFSGAQISTGTASMYHLSPFGYTRVDTEHQSIVSLFSVGEHKSEDPEDDLACEAIHIGLRDVQPSENLSLFFQIEDAGTNFERGSSKVVWAYLNQNKWEYLKAGDLIEDTTKGLRFSGIVQLKVPEKTCTSSTLFPSGLHWFKASSLEEGEILESLKSVRAQALVATYQNNSEQPSVHLNHPLPSGTVDRLKRHRSGIKRVEQVGDSFGGRSYESNLNFYRRVSERLRHKNRAISVHDYERLVLENFPEVHKVKCINHANYKSKFEKEFQPGNVHVVVVPQFSENPFPPQLSSNKLEEIERYLQERASKFAEIIVKNPDYEYLRVDCNVTFTEDCEERIGKERLKKDVKHLLSPWREKDAAIYHNGIHKIWLENRILEFEYVHEVNQLKLCRDQGKSDPIPIVNDKETMLEGSSSNSVLVSSAELINIITEKQQKKSEMNN